MKRNIIFLFFLLVLLAACSMSGDSIEGRVVEEESRKPIEGAIVVVLWEGYISALVDSQRVCVYVQTTITDKNGYYKFPAWKKSSEIGPVQKIKPGITVYKIGYQWPDKTLGKNNEYHLTPAKGTSSEKLAYLSRVAISCSDKRDVEINLLPLYKALYKEAKDLAVTKEDKLKALYRLRDVERLELGTDFAWEKFHLRKDKL